MAVGGSASAAFHVRVRDFEAAVASDDALLDRPLRFWVDAEIIVTTRAPWERELGDLLVEVALLCPRAHVVVAQVLIERPGLLGSALGALRRRAGQWVDDVVVPALAESFVSFLRRSDVAEVVRMSSLRTFVNGWYTTRHYGRLHVELWHGGRGFARELLTLRPCM